MPKVSFRQDRCKGCGLCVSVCPKKIIAIDSAVLNDKLIWINVLVVRFVQQCVLIA